ncbi:MAG: hypothetical protein NPIRA02_39670 [Nitrospirales bacterium]|nr:MAG: hypothetical protein NPIRA02_39670 [Nitrospirales bacterium]
MCEGKEAARGTWAPVIVLAERRIHPNNGKMAVPYALWPIVPKATALSLGYDSGTTITTLMNPPLCEGSKLLLL